MDIKMTFKQIEKMQYGSSNQMTEADEWYNRFMKFEERHPELVDEIWDRIHLTDVGYQARRRWLSNQ